MASCCADCWAALPKITTARCRSCAQPAPLRDLERWICLSCERDPLPLEWCEAWGEYRGGLERLLHAFKFARHDFLDVPLASLLEQRLREGGDLAFDAVVAVPMTRSRERARGYNQAGLLGRALANRAGLPWEPQLLVKAKDRERQATLPRKERAVNVRGAFGATAATDGRAILLVDDICTTGETLRACAGALIAAGATRVCAVTVAKAI
jgi:ComF family protein